VKKIVLYFLTGVMAVMFAASVYAATYDVQQLNGKIKVDFLEQFRVETWSAFDTGVSGMESDYGFASSKMRIGFGYDTTYIDTYAQLHWTQFFGLPSDATYGTGGLYYGANNGSNKGYAGISQAWLRARMPWVKGLSARFGRMKLNGGLEANTLPQNKTLRWLRQKRISQRMLGAFEWSRVGRSFDGFDAAYDTDTWNITTTFSHPRPGGFYLNIMDTSDNGYSTDDIDIVTVTVTMKDRMVAGLDAQAFYYYYNDHRGLKNQKIADEAEVSTFGANLLYNTPKVGPGAFDFLFWGVFQGGVWTPPTGPREDQQGYALAFEGGYKFHDVMWQPWLRMGYFYGSGDSDPTDNDHDTFFQMIPTLRIYAMTPFYNLMNTKYFFGEIMFKPWEKLLVRTDVTKLNLTNSNDGWYQGSGMTQADSFGYVAKTGHIGTGHDSIGTMWDISLFFKDLCRYQGASLGLNLYYSHVFGNNVVEDNFADKSDMDFFYVEGIIKF